MTIKKSLLTLTLLITTTATFAANKQELPAPIEALQARGIQIVGTFQTPGELTGYAGIAGRRPVAIYLTADKQHAIIGNMIDSSGSLVDRETVQQMTAGPMSKRIWSQLEKSTWVAEGADDAPRTVYIFSDPNCPYCHVFWKRAQPWVDAGKVQLRHITVGVIGQSSPNKVAAILTADDPEQAFLKNQNQFADGGISPLETIPAEISAQLMANQQLMAQLGIRGTPGIVYRNSEGRVQVSPGVPPEQDMTKILGPVPE